MTLDIDETLLAHHLDGMKKLAELNNSAYNEYPKIYADYLNAYSFIGLYVTYNNGKHVVKRSVDLV